MITKFQWCNSTTLLNILSTTNLPISSNLSPLSPILTSVLPHLHPFFLSTNLHSLLRVQGCFHLIVHSFPCFSISHTWAKASSIYLSSYFASSSMKKKTVWAFLKILKIDLPYDPATPLFGNYAEKTNNTPSKTAMYLGSLGHQR